MPSIIINDPQTRANGALGYPYVVTTTGAATTCAISSNAILIHLDTSTNGGNVKIGIPIDETFLNGEVSLTFTLPATLRDFELDIAARDDLTGTSSHVYSAIGTNVAGSVWGGYLYDLGDAPQQSNIALPTITASHQYGAKFIFWGKQVGYRVWDITAGQTEGSVGSTSLWGNTVTYLTAGYVYLDVSSQSTVGVQDFIIDDLIVMKYNSPYPVVDRGTVVNVAAGATSVITITSPTTVALNNYLILNIAVDNSGASGARPGITSIVDSRSNTWTVLQGGLADPSSINLGSAHYMAYAKVGVVYQAADTITITWTTGTPAAKAVVSTEWANIHLTTPVAVAIVTSTGATTAMSSGNITPLKVDQVVLGSFSVEAPNTDTISTGGDQDNIEGAWAIMTGIGSTNATADLNQKIVIFAKSIVGTGTPGAQSLDITWSATRDWAGGIIVIQPPVGPAAIKSVNTFNTRNRAATF